MEITETKKPEKSSVSGLTKQDLEIIARSIQGDLGAVTIRLNESYDKDRINSLRSHIQVRLKRIIKDSHISTLADYNERTITVWIENK